MSANAPGGGFTWDGRANTLAEQVSIPLLSSFEMANASQAAVVQVVQNASYAALFQQAFGANVFSDTATAFTDVGLALQQYQLEDPSFHPYTSKYDYTFLVELSNGQARDVDGRGDCGATTSTSIRTRAIASPATTTAR